MPERLPATEEQFRLYVVAALGRLETKVNSLLGNGQPGRIQSLEHRVTRHEKYVWMMLGAGMLLSWIVRSILADLGVKLP